MAKPAKTILITEEELRELIREELHAELVHLFPEPSEIVQEEEVLPVREPSSPREERKESLRSALLYLMRLGFVFKTDEDKAMLMEIISEEWKLSEPS